MKNRELEQQIQELLDGCLEETEARALVDELVDDEDALELYCQYAVIDSALLRMMEGKMELSEEDSIAVIAQKRSRLRSWEFTAMAAAAIVLVTLVTLRLILITDRPPVLTLRAVPDTIYEVTASEDGGKDPTEGTLTIGSRLQISQGTMELKFQSGVTSVVQAPVDLTLTAKDRINLREGTGWFQVPTEGTGFTVITPELEIVDLGTEFGVVATPDAGDEVHVFQGKVMARSRSPLQHEATLTASEARLSDPVGRLQKTASRPGDFLNTLPDSLPHLYFSFDEREGNRLEVSGSHPAVTDIEPELLTENPAACLVPGVSGTALELRADGDCIHTDWMGFPGRTPRSVSCWLQIPGDAHQHRSLPAIIGWGDPTNGLNSRWKVVVSEEDAAGRVYPRISFGIERFDGSTALNDGGWHHLVVIYTGRMLDSGLPEVAMYVDGERESLTRKVGVQGVDAAPLEVRTLTKSSSARPLCIGMGVETLAPPPVFRGRIDELYIFQGAISEETVQSLLHKTPISPQS